MLDLSDCAELLYKIRFAYKQSADDNIQVQPLIERKDTRIKMLFIASESVFYLTRQNIDLNPEKSVQNISINLMCFYSLIKEKRKIQTHKPIMQVTFRI